MIPSRPPWLAPVCLFLALTACERGLERSTLVVAMPRARSGVTVRVVQDELDESPVPGFGIVILPDSFPAFGPVVEMARWSASVPGVLAVVGPAQIRGSLISAPIFQQAGVPHIVPTATSPALEEAGPWTFTQVPGTSAQAEFIVDFVRTELGARTVTVFYSSNEYGMVMKDAVVRSLEQSNVRTLDVVPTVSIGDVGALVASALLRGEPDVVVVLSGPGNAERVIEEWAASGAGSIVVASDRATRGLDPEHSLDPDRLFRVGFWHWATPESASQAFVTRFRDRHGRLPLQQEALDYDAITLVIEAVREVGTKGSALRAYLSAVGEGLRPVRSVRGSSRDGMVMIDHRADTVVATHLLAIPGSDSPHGGMCLCGGICPVRWTPRRPHRDHNEK